MMMVVGEVIDAAAGINADLWRRYLRIALHGLRPEEAALEPLPVDAV